MSDPPIELESEIDRLYSLPLSQFVEARNQLAARLRKATRKDEASRVKTLAKPSLAAWAVNQLYWKRRPMWEGLIRAGDALRDVAGKPAANPQLTQRRRDAAARLLAEAEAILTEGGHATGASTLKQIHDSLEAASIYGDQLPGEPAGRLTQSLEPPGFEGLLSLAATLPSPRARPGKPPQPEPRPKATTSAGLRFARAQLARAEREAARKRREAQEASTHADELEQRASRSRSEIEALEQRLEELRQKHELQATEVQQALQSAEAAAASLAKAEAELESARTRVEKSSKRDA